VKFFPTFMDPQSPSNDTVVYRFDAGWLGQFLVSTGSEINEADYHALLFPEDE
jgi:hypothetical protein